MSVCVSVGGVHLSGSFVVLSVVWRYLGAFSGFRGVVPLKGTI